MVAIIALKDPLSMRAKVCSIRFADNLPPVNTLQGADFLAARPVAR